LTTTTLIFVVLTLFAGVAFASIEGRLEISGTAGVVLDAIPDHLFQSSSLEFLPPPSTGAPVAPPVMPPSEGVPDIGSPDDGGLVVAPPDIEDEPEEGEEEPYPGYEPEEENDNYYDNDNHYDNDNYYDDDDNNHYDNSDHNDNYYDDNGEYYVADSDLP